MRNLKALVSKGVCHMSMCVPINNSSMNCVKLTNTWDVCEQIIFVEKLAPVS